MQIVGYELQRIGTGEDSEPVIIFRGDRPSASPWLLDRFRDGELYWDGAEVEFGLILSGEKLVDNLDFRSQLQKLEPEVVGGEMEGAGLYAAAYLQMEGRQQGNEKIGSEEVKGIEAGVYSCNVVSSLLMCKNNFKLGNECKVCVPRIAGIFPACRLCLRG